LAAGALPRPRAPARRREGDPGRHDRASARQGGRRRSEQRPWTGRGGRRVKASGFSGGKVLVLVGIVVAAGIGISFAPGSWFGKASPAEVRGALVRRGPLRISVLQRGELSPKKYTSIKNEIQG